MEGAGPSTLPGSRPPFLVFCAHLQAPSAPACTCACAHTCYASILLIATLRPWALCLLTLLLVFDFFSPRIGHYSLSAFSRPLTRLVSFEKNSVGVIVDEAHSLVRCGRRRNFPFVRGSRHSGAQADGVHPALPCLGSARHGAPLGARVSSVQASRETASLLRDPPPRAGRRGPGPSRALCLLPAASVLLSGPRASPADLPANLLTRRPRVIRS